MDDLRLRCIAIVLARCCEPHNRRHTVRSSCKPISIVHFRDKPKTKLRSCVTWAQATRLTCKRCGIRVLDHVLDSLCPIYTRSQSTSLSCRAIMIRITPGLVIILASIANCQQLSGFYSYVNYPGLSQGCVEALNTSVPCPPLLSTVAVKYIYWHSITEIVTNLATVVQSLILGN